MVGVSQARAKIAAGAGVIESDILARLVLALCSVRGISYFILILMLKHVLYSIV